MLFHLKSVLGTLLSPVAGGMVLFVVAAGLLFTERFRTAGRWILAVGLPLFFLLGTSPVAERLIRPFETRYETVHDPRFFGEEIRWVVVLGHSHVSDPRRTAPARLRDEGLYRVVEGVRLHRMLPGSRLVTSGYGGGDERSYAEGARDAAVALGVDPDAVVLLPTPRDTGEEAEAVRELIEPGDRFLLVTSAAHMPRSVHHFRARGLDPIPAPAQAYALEGRRLRFQDLVPQARNYRMVERAVHEALGLLWGRLTVRGGG